VGRLVAWNGDAIARDIERAAREGTVATVDAAVDMARPNVPVETGRARDSLRREGDGLDISWGFHVAYGIWLEIGEQGRAGLHILRRAADATYGSLVSRIRSRMRPR
jgi:hypothetical protein